METAQTEMDVVEEKNSMGFLAGLADTVALTVQRRLKTPPDPATEVGLEVADAMRRLWGGIAVYVCKTDGAGLSARDGEVYEAWREGGFSLALCRRFGLSEQRIRQIVALKRRERRQRADAPSLPWSPAS